MIREAATSSTLRATLAIYGGAVLATALAVLVRWLADPWLGNQFPVVTLFPALAFAVWIGGYRPALIPTLAGYVACDYLFIEPRYTFDLFPARDVIGTFRFYVSCGVIIGLGEAVRSASRRLRAEEEAAKRTEAAHQSTIQHLQIVAESMAALVTRCSREFRYLWASKSFTDWIGLPADQIVGRSIADIVGQEAFEQLLPRFQQVLRGEKVQYEDAFHYKGLGRRWINAVYTPTFDAAGVPDGWVAVIIDVTEQKQLEDQLRQRAEEIEKLMDLVPMGVFIAHDPECHRITGNRAAYDMMRLPPGSNVSITPPPGETPPITALRDGKPMPPEELPVQYAARHAKDVRDVEVEHLYPDGSTRTLFGSASPLFDAQGKVRGCVGSFLDITDRKQLEAELRQRVAQLADADRRKDEFLATLAHELRNPLAPITNAVALLRGSNGNAALTANARAMIERQLDQMTRLVDDLLDISRITNGKLQIRKEPVDVAEVIRSALEAVRPILESQRHTFTLALPSDPVFLDADPIRLAQVFANLLNNAAKYTDRGGHLWLRAEPTGGEVVVSVRDTGIGIAAEHLTHIFDMFSQVTPALERSQGGLGIGLALVRGLVELHGGKIEAHSGGPGKGSEFVVHLPLAHPVDELSSPAPTNGELSPRGPRRRILIVDDNRDAADSLATMLHMLGHEIDTAYDGLEAVQSAATLRPEVVVLDIGLPKMNGYEAARHLRAQPWGEDMLLIALTGWGQDEDKRRAAEAGFDHHVTKPVTVATLEGLLTGPKPTAVR
jgi:PAS domain S-box-containing protein